MKKNILWMLTGLAAIFICGLTVTTLSACSSDDDKNDKAITYGRLHSVSPPPRAL